MSMVMELIAAVTNAERQLDVQISKLQTYQAEIDNAQKRVDAAFSGSTVTYGQNMIEQLLKTKKQVNYTIGMLQKSKEKLMQVRMI